MVQRETEGLMGDVLERVLDKGIVVAAVPRPTPRWVLALRRTPVADPGRLRVALEAFDAWNARDLNRYAALLADGFICQTHQLSAALYGRPAARRAMRRYCTAYPDLHFTVERTLASDDNVMISWLATATSRVGGRGGPLQVPGCTVGLLKGGMIVHAWTYWDRDEFVRPLRGGGHRGFHDPKAGHRGPRAS